MNGLQARLIVQNLAVSKQAAALADRPGPRCRSARNPAPDLILSAVPRDAEPVALPMPDGGPWGVASGLGARRPVERLAIASDKHS